MMLNDPPVNLFSPVPRLSSFVLFCEQRRKVTLFRPVQQQCPFVCLYHRLNASVVEQILLCLYGSASVNLRDCKVMELVAAADMYTVNSVKDIVSYELKMDYCHFFHRVNGNVLQLMQNLRSGPLVSITPGGARLRCRCS